MLLLKRRLTPSAVDPRTWGTSNRPTPRAVQALVILAIAVPAVCVGIAGFAVGQILTVHWPEGGAK